MVVICFSAPGQPRLGILPLFFDFSQDSFPKQSLVESHLSLFALSLLVSQCSDSDWFNYDLASLYSFIHGPRALLSTHKWIIKVFF